MNERRTYYVPTGLMVRSGADGAPTRTIAGTAILFETPSRKLWDDEEGEAAEVIARGAVTRELLDASDIKMTLFHDDTLILARSVGGTGTLSYDVDDEGVHFSFEAPHTDDGDKALELVSRGDIQGCSFAFTTRCDDPDYMERQAEWANGREIVTYRIKRMTGIYDFTLTPDPVYPDTSVSVREFDRRLRGPRRDVKRANLDKIRDRINRRV